MNRKSKEYLTFNMINFQSPIKFSAIFEEEPKTLDSYLKGIKRSDLLNVMTYFNSLINRGTKANNIEFFFTQFFSEGNNEFANKVYDKVIHLYTTVQPTPVFVNPITILRVFEFCFDHLTEEETQSKLEVERNIFKAILLINEEIILREDVAISSTIHLQPNLKKAAAMSLVNSFPYSGITNYNLHEVFISELFKSFILFDFLNSHTEAQYLLGEFLSYFGVSDWKIFLGKYQPLISSLFSNNDIMNKEIRIEGNQYYKDQCEFLDKLTVSGSENISDNAWDFRAIRSKPFYKISEGNYNIIHEIFVMELLFKGVYFKLRDLNEKLKSNIKVKDLRRIYTEDFSEKYLLCNILKYIYQNRGIEFSESDMKSYYRSQFNIAEIQKHGLDKGLPDFYVRKGNAIFLFESKDILINSSLKITYDFSKYEIELDSKLYKAVSQSVNRVEKVLNKHQQFIFDNYNENQVSIYPIIVLHDRQFLDINGLNILIDFKFQKELIKLKAKGLKVNKVKPITVINIDTLILYQEALKKGSIELDGAIDYYSCTRLKYPQNSSCLVPFADFLQKYCKNKNVQGVQFPKFLEGKVNALEAFLTNIL